MPMTLSIYCIVHKSSALGIMWNIQIMSSLQVDNLFIISSWIQVILLSL